MWSTLKKWCEAGWEWYSKPKNKEKVDKVVDKVKDKLDD